MKTRFIFNPRSGRHRRNAKLLPLLRELVGQRTAEADLAVTEGPGHATALAQEAVAAGCQRVVAVGGDGTVNEIAQALVQTPAALALVPCGSGNGLALHLGLPASLRRALNLACGEPAAGAIRIALLDTGTVNGRPFFNVMGLGLDAEVSRRFNALTRRGLPAYTRAALAAFFHCRGERCTIVDTRGREEVEILLLSIANSDQYGNRAIIAPGAKVDDGALDLVALPPAGPLGALVLGTRLFLGTLDRSPHVKRRRAARFVIERSAPGIIHTDGETHAESATLEIIVHPRSLRVVVPAACRAVAPAQNNSPVSFALQPP